MTIEQSTLMNATIEKYGSRNWAVRINGELLAVTVYRKGAQAIIELIQQLACGKPLPIISDCPKFAV